MADREYIKKVRRGEINLLRDGEYWSPEEKQQLYDAFLDGAELTELAIEYQRSERALVQQLSLMRSFAESSKHRHGSEHKSFCKCYTCKLYQTPQCTNCAKNTVTKEDKNV